LLLLSLIRFYTEITKSEGGEGSMTKHEWTRRDFLKGTAAGIAGITTAGLTFGCAGKPAAESTEAGTSSAAATAETAEKTTAAGEMADWQTGTGGITSEQYRAKWNFEIPPEPISDEEIAETIEAEVIVVGAGTAGLIAANSALDEGLDVCLITASSIPIYRGGSNHAVMSKTKEKFNLPPDDEMLFEREIINNGMSVDQRKWYDFYNHSEEAMNWLIDIMESKGYETGLEQPTQFLENGNYFNFTGAHGFMTADSHTMGMNQEFVVNELAARLADAKKPVLYKKIARQLVRENNGTGRVTAVIAEQEDGSYVKYVGTKAIILATGDFSSNREMMYKYAPYTAQIISDEVYDAEPDYDKCFVYGGLYPGDGQKMGLWAGAAWQKNWPCAPMGGGINPGPMNSDMIFSGLRVDRSGERFMNEYGVRDMGSFTNRIQPGNLCYAIWDAGYAAKYPFTWLNGSTPYGEDASIAPADVLAGWEDSAKNGVYFKADTIEELIDQMGLPKTTVDTVKHYNELCHAGKDADFHKDPSLMIPIEEGPFFGQKGDAALFLTILGGLRTNSHMQVCDENDDPIPGLYNVGTMVGDMYAVNYTFQIPGLNLGATCVTFGYMVGKYIAENE
jgi:fumarate reductase flavoprotein subunit